MPPLRRPTPGHPRVERTRGRILAVARELLPDVGPVGLTYSLLADRAGVTRQTLYRHWPTRAALLVDLILTGPESVPEAGYPEPGTDPGQVARQWLTSLRAGMNDRATRTAVLAVTAQADSDPDSAEAVERISADRLAAFNLLLAPSGRQSTAEEYALLVGPVFARLFYDRAEVTAEFIDMVVFHWLAAGRHRYDRCEQGE
jgi:AcrR family transcriptional regulator